MKQGKRALALFLAFFLILGCSFPVSAVEESPDTEDEYVVNSKGIQVKKSLLCEDPDCLEKHVGNTIEISQLPLEQGNPIQRMAEGEGQGRLLSNVYVGMVVTGEDARVAFWGKPGTAGVHEYAIYDGGLAGLRGNAMCINHGAANPGEGFWQTCSYRAECKVIQGNQAEWEIVITPPGAWDGVSHVNGLPAGYQRLGVRVRVPFEEPKGGLTVQKETELTELTKENKSYSLEGAVYGVFQNGEEKSRSTTDKAGRLQFQNMLKGEYVLKEIKAPKGYTLDPKEYPVTIVAGTIISKTVKEVPQYAPVDICLKKIDEDTGNPLPQGKGTLKDAEFTIRFYSEQMETDPGTKGKQPLRTWVMKTDDQGQILMDEAHRVSGDAFYTVSGKTVFPLGTVTVQETKAPKGYVINPKVVVCPIKDNTTGKETTVYEAPTIPDKVIRGDVEIHKFKHPEDADPVDLQGIRFTFTSKTTGKLTAELVTDEKGWGTTYDAKKKGGSLPYDTYLVEEDLATIPEGLEPVKPFEVTISKDKQVEKLEVENKEILAPVKLVKVDATTGKQIPVANVTFQLLDQKKQVIPLKTKNPKKEQKEFKTDDKGTFLLPKRLKYGTYYFREIQAPEGYVLSKEDLLFEVKETLDWDHPLLLFFENEPAKGTIFIEKLDEETNQSIPTGATFEIKAKEDIVTSEGTLRVKKGEVVETLTTGKTGKVKSKPLFLGTYEVRETQAPEGYLLNQDVVEVELSYEGQRVSIVSKEVQVIDEPVIGQLRLEKRDGETNRPITICAEFEIVAKEDIVTPDGTVREKAGTVVETIQTNYVGKAESKPLYLGTYLVKEKKAPHGYVGKEEPYEVTFTYKDQNTAIVYESIIVENVPAKGQIQIQKTDKGTGKIIPTGAIFEVTAKRDILTGDGTVRVKEGEVVDRITTNEKGIATTIPLYLGEYEVQEVKAPEGYLPLEKPFSVRLKYADQKTELIVEKQKVENDYTKIDLSKHDETTEKTIEGGRYQLLDVKGTVLDEWDGKKEPHRVERLAVGKTYIFREVLAPEGYLLGQDVRFQVENTDLVQKVKMQDQLAMGTIGIQKQEAETGVYLSGVTFQIYAAEDIVTPDGTVRLKQGELADEVVTEEGFAKTKKLFLGAYEVVESKALPGYVREKTSYPVKLVYEDQYTAVVKEHLELQNQPTTILLEKRIKGTDKPLPGVTYRMWKSEGFFWNEWKKKETAQEWMTDAEGKILWKYVEPGEYCIQETKTVPGYLLDETIYKIRINEDGKIVTESGVKEGKDAGKGTLLLDNDYTKVSISKQDAETEKELSGAELKLIRKDTKAVVEKWCSTETAKVFDALEPGEYVLREVQAPKGYKLAVDVPFTVEEHGELQKVVMKDEKFGKVIKPKRPEKPRKGNRRSPKTGDNLWSMGVMLCVIGTILLVSFGVGYCLFSFGEKCSILINKHRLKREGEKKHER